MPEKPSHDPAGRGAGEDGPLEERLKAAREARGLSLTDVQQETRIPADVLQRLEDGRLLGDASFSPVYLKALLKAYAGAVGLPADDILRRFDPGTHRLPASPPHAVVVGTSPAPPPDPVAEAAPTRPRSTGKPGDGGEAKPAAGIEPTAPAVAPAGESSTPAAPGVGAGPAAPAPPETPAVALPGLPTPEPVPSSVPSLAPLIATREGASHAGPEPEKKRVMTAEQARTPRAFDRSWGMIIGGTVGIAVLIGGLLFLLFRDRTPAPERRPDPVAADTAASPDTAVVAQEEAPVQQGPTLAMPIRVTVTAGGDGLQNFRVTAEPNQRLGHWIEAGESMTFESPTAVTLWGEGAEGLGGEATIDLQGLQWSPADGQVLRIDAQSGQRLLDSLSANG